MVKRIMLFLAAVVLAFAGNAFATDITTATFGEQNSSGAYRVKAIIDSATGNGTVVYASDTGIQYPYENYTSANTANTLNDYETGKTIADNGGSTGDATLNCPGGGSTHTLPRAEAGLEFTLTSPNKCEVCLDVVDSSDQFRYSISGTVLSAGDKIVSTSQAGDSVTVFSTVANKWEIKAMHGVWSDGN